MRIALFHNLPSGGAKRTMYEYVRRLSTRHEFDVFTLASANHTFADIRPFVKRYQVLPFQPGRLFSSPFGRLNQLIRLDDLRRVRSAAHRIAQQIDSGGYDMVFVQPCQIEGSPSVLRFLRKTRSVYYCHEPLRILYEKMPDRPYYQRESALRRGLNRVDPLPWLYRLTLKHQDAQNIRSADQVVVNSNFTRLAVNQIYQVKAQIAHPGVDTDLFQKQAVEKQPFFLSVGSLTPLKGFDFLIRSLALLPVEQRLPLVIASNFQNPPERAYLEDLASRVSVNLTLTSDIDDAALVLLYNQTILTLYSAIREPLGLVPIESMACGTPLVAIKEGGMMETVPDGQAGWLTERSEAAFADAVQRLYSQPERRAQFGDYGRKHVQAHWTWDTAVQCLEENFNLLIK